MNLKKMKRMISASILIGACMLTGCAGNADAGIRNGSVLSAMPASDTGVAQDTSAMESSGYVDYSVYEAYGLFYDEKAGCYIYNGSIVRFFNDPAAGAGFTNFFTGTVDIEVVRDAGNNLTGIEECSQEVYERHTKKHERFLSKPADMRADTAQQNGTGRNSVEWMNEYEDYGISYHSQDGCLYYDGDEVRILVDSEKACVYSTDEKGICLAVSRDENHAITGVKVISESEAMSLLQANKPDAENAFAAERN